MWFETQIEAAVDVNKPIIVHSREACADTIQCMKIGEQTKPAE